MDSDVETVLSRPVRDKAVAHFQILPLVGGEGDAVPVCYVVICPGLKQAFRTLLREAQGEAVTIITGPPCFHIPEHCNVCTSSDPSLAHVQHAVTGFYSYIVLSYFPSPFPVLSVLLTIPSHLLE